MEKQTNEDNAMFHLLIGIPTPPWRHSDQSESSLLFQGTKLVILLYHITLSILFFVVTVSPSHGQGLKNDTPFPAKWSIENVPHIQQVGAGCGPASLAMVLNYWGIQIGQDALARSMGTTTGTSPKMMVNYPRSLGLVVENRSGSIERIAEEISNDRPVIVMQWLSYIDRREARVLHYRVVTGYDSEKKLIFMNDPNKNGHSRLDFDVFADLWDTRAHPHGSKNWMLVISKKCGIRRQKSSIQ